MEVNKKHYYLSIEQYGNIIDAYFSCAEAVGQPVEWMEKHLKDVWTANFKLYVETESILERIKDPYYYMYPLYRSLGQDDEDYVFETREEAEKEYADQIGQSIAERLYDL